MNIPIAVVPLSDQRKPCLDVLGSDLGISAPTNLALKNDNGRRCRQTLPLNYKYNLQIEAWNQSTVKKASDLDCDLLKCKR